MGWGGVGWGGRRPSLTATAAYVMPAAISAVRSARPALRLLLQALEEGLTCQQICDKYHAIHKVGAQARPRVPRRPRSAAVPSLCAKDTSMCIQLQRPGRCAFKQRASVPPAVPCPHLTGKCPLCFLQAIYDWFDIGFDKFGRTPSRAQTQIGQARCGAGQVVASRAGA